MAVIIFPNFKEESSEKVYIKAAKKLTDLTVLKWTPISWLEDCITSNKK